MCTFYSYFWVPDRELTTKGLVCIPSRTLETVNETEVLPLSPPPALITAALPLLSTYLLLLGLVSCLFTTVKSNGICLPPLPYFCPVCLGESGEGHVFPQGLSFLISEDKGWREMQGPAGGPGPLALVQS